MKPDRKTVLLGLILSSVLSGIVFGGCLQPETSGPSFEQVRFTQDTRNQTLTVNYVNETYSLPWDNITVEGTGIIPLGIITVGDTITNCTGDIKLIIQYNSHYTGNSLYRFANKENDLDRVIGTWIADETVNKTKINDYEGTFTFYSNGTFLKNQTGYPSVEGVWDLDYKPFTHYRSYILNDLMLILMDTNTTIYTYQFNVYEDGKIQLFLGVDIYSIGPVDPTFYGATLVKQ
ncbi:MAG: hypothetical protein V1726_04855 [Methanobacteriota archaeon]